MYQENEEEEDDASLYFVDWCQDCGIAVDMGELSVLHCDYITCASCLRERAMDFISPQKSSNNRLCPDCGSEIDPDIFLELHDPSVQSTALNTDPQKPFPFPGIEKCCDEVFPKENMKDPLPISKQDEIKKEIHEASFVPTKCPLCDLATQTQVECQLSYCHKCRYIFCAKCNLEYHGMEDCPVAEMETQDKEVTKESVKNSQALLVRRYSSIEEDPFNTVICVICMQRISPSNVMDFGCQHKDDKTCKTCMKHYFEALIRNGEVSGYKCPTFGCDKVASENAIRSLVDKKLFQRLANHKFKNDGFDLKELT